jgi:hypothetical protein
MTVTAPAPPISPSSQVTAQCAWASGVIGLAAAGFIIAAAELRAFRVVSGAVSRFLFSSHDVASILQSLLLIPAVFVVHRLSRSRSPTASTATLGTGVTALAAIAVLQLLLFVGAAPGTLYMLPQGLLGVWVIVVSRLMANTWPRHVTWLGIAAGVGLILISASLAGLLVYFGPGALASGPALDDPQARLVNRLLHINLHFATSLGKPLYPVWVLLIAGRLQTNDAARL